MITAGLKIAGPKYADQGRGCHGFPPFSPTRTGRNPIGQAMA